MIQRADIRRCAGRTYWGVLAFLAGFVVLLLVVSRQFLIPALDASRHADPAGKKLLGGVSWLMLALLLVYIIAGLMLTFRIGRFFFPRPRSPRVHTRYVDAWAEAGRRMSEKPGDEE